MSDVAFLVESYVIDLWGVCEFTPRGMEKFLRHLERETRAAVLTNGGDPSTVTRESIASQYFPVLTIAASGFLEHYLTHGHESPLVLSVN